MQKQQKYFNRFEIKYQIPLRKRDNLFKLIRANVAKNRIYVPLEKAFNILDNNHPEAKTFCKNTFKKLKVR